MGSTASAWSCAMVAALASSALLADPPTPRPKVIYEPMVLSGEQAPGFSPGQTFTFFPYHSFIGDDNHTVFLASVGNSGGQVSPNAIYQNFRGQTVLMARTYQQAPGLAPGVQIGSFDVNYHRTNSSGQAVFETTLMGPGMLGTGDDHTNAIAEWIFSNGQLTKILQYRDPAPGAPGDIVTNMARITLNNLGDVAFSGYLEGPDVTADNQTAFWYGKPYNLQILARQGDAVPGNPSVHYGMITGFDHPILSSNGAVAFTATMTLPGAPPFLHEGVVAGTPGHLAAVAIPGQSAPGTSANFNSANWNLDVNNKAEVSFSAILDDGTRGLYTGPAENLRLLARTGDAAPGRAGMNYDYFYGTRINDRGEVAFLADTAPDDDNSYAVYLAKSKKAPELIAAAGLPAPGTGGDVVFGNWFSDPILNKDGQVAFFATLDGPGSRGPDDYAIFATGHSGDLRLIARYGDPFEVAPGDVRTILALSPNGVLGTHELTFNEDSNLSFLAKFTDGSEGLFTATVLPEPGAAILLLGIAPMLIRRRQA